MTRRLSALLLSALAASPGFAMTDRSPSSSPAPAPVPARALALDVRQGGGTIEVTLTGAASEPQEVAYTLEVSGTSTSRHRGNTTLAGGKPAVLSTIRVSAGADWCVRLLAEEAGREPYEIVKGNCGATTA